MRCLWERDSGRMAVSLMMSLSRLRGIHQPWTRGMSLLIATWIGAIATVVLAVGAVVTAWYAIKAYRDQSKQTRLLQDQTIRDIEFRRRAQASGVFVWVEDRAYDDNPDDMRAAACIRNTSNQPVYDVALGLGEAIEKCWAVLMPEGEHVRPGLGTPFADGTRPVWAEFRDSAGVRWRADAMGGLTELPEDEAKQAGVGR